MGLFIGVMSVIGLGYMIWATQFTKWEDRRDHKRWWEDTPGSRPPTNRR